MNPFGERNRTVYTEDGRIIGKCLNGEPAAFGLLVDKYKSSVYALAYTKLRNFHDAEDITQEVFIKAYQKLSTLKQRDNFLAWLFSITVNSCKNFLTSRSRRPDRDYIEDQHTAILDTPSIDAYRSEAAAESIRDAINQLPEIYRQTLTLYYLGGLSSKEIARFLGTSVNTVNQRLMRARTKLKEELISMINTTFAGEKLQSGFTFRIVEAIKSTKVQPISTKPLLPFIGSATVGIVLTFMLFNQFLRPVATPGDLASSPLPIEIQMTMIGEIPVELVAEATKPPTVFGERGSGVDGNSPAQPQQMNAADVTLPQDASEWGLPEGAKARLGKGAIEQIQYSPDGARLAVGSSVGIWLYDTTTEQEIALLTGHSGIVGSVAFSPDGSTLASGGSGKIVRLWDAVTGAHLHTLEGETDGVLSVVFSPDGSALARVSQTTVDLWDVETKTYTRSLELRTPQGDTYSVSTVAFSPDGGILASGGSGSTIGLWNVVTGTRLRELEGHKNSVSGIAFSPDGATLVSGSDDATIRLWDPATGAQLGTLKGHINYVTSIAFSPDGATLVSASRSNPIRLWDAATGEYKRSLMTWYLSEANSIAFSPDGLTLAGVNAFHNIDLWNFKSGKVRTLQNLEIPKVDDGLDHSIAFSPDGSTVAGWNGETAIRLWNAETGAQLHNLHWESSDTVPRVYSPARSTLAFSPDGATLASGCADATIRLWEVATGKHRRTLEGHTAYITSVAFSSDGNKIASGSGDHSVRIWDTATGTHRRTLEGHTAEVSAVAFSPDGRLLASGGGWGDSAIRIWDVHTETHRRTLKGHAAYVGSLAFSPDGSTLGSGSYDGTVLLWDLSR